MVTDKQRAELTRAYAVQAVQPSKVLVACAAGLLILTGVTVQADELPAGAAGPQASIEQAAMERATDARYPADAEDQYAGVVFYDLLRKGTLLRTQQAQSSPRLTRVSYSDGRKAR